MLEIDGQRRTRRSESRSAIPSGTAAEQAGRSSARSAWPSRPLDPRGGRRIRGSFRPRSGAPRHRRSAGRKSTSRRLPTVAVPSTIVSPERATTAPPAWRASLPVSKEISSPPTSTETRLTSNMLIYYFPSAARMAAQSLKELLVLVRLAMLQGKPGDVEIIRQPGRRPGTPPGSRHPRADPALEIAATPARRSPSERRSRSKRSRSSPSAFARSHRCGSPPSPVGVDRVHERPERLLALQRRRLGGGMEGGRAGMLAGHREVAEHEAQRPPLQLRPDRGAMRACEVEVQDQLPPSPRTWSSGPTGGRWRW